MVATPLRMTGLVLVEGKYPIFGTCRLKVDIAFRYSIERSISDVPVRLGSMTVSLFHHMLWRRASRFVIIRVRMGPLRLVLPWEAFKLSSAGRLCPHAVPENLCAPCQLTSKQYRKSDYTQYRAHALAICPNASHEISTTSISSSSATMPLSSSAHTS